jgi:hypothetical protein
MITQDETLYYFNVRSQQKFWREVYPAVTPASRFYIDIARRINPHRLCNRNDSEWSLPWKQHAPDKFKMLPYDPTFNKTYEEVTDERALEIRDGIYEGKKYAVMYSGGMDSTSVVVALLKNLTEEELESVVICASIHSLVEYPLFWRKYIQGKFKVLDSNTYLYDDYINMGYTPITADEGDCIFGTSIGLQLYHNYDYYVSLQDPAVQGNLMKLKYKIADGEVHYTLFKDIIARYFALDDSPYGLEFGRLLYHKYHRNIVTSNVPVYTLHDFFWWLIFNVKYLNCSIRGAIYFNRTMPFEKAVNSIENWFNGSGFQYWSMNNNNNGTKIHNTLATYKIVQRKYIHDFTKDDWYYWYKTKLESMGNLSVKGKNDLTKSFTNSVVGINDKNEYLCIPDAEDMEAVEQSKYEGIYHYGPDVREFFNNCLMNYEIDWVDD